MHEKQINFESYRALVDQVLIDIRPYIKRKANNF